MNKITLALLITKPGHLRNGLHSLLRTVPQIEIIAESNDPSILLKMNESIQPELIVIDGSVIDEINLSNITKTKKDWPSIQILVLTNDKQQGMATKKAGADHYLLKGVPATDLAQLIETCLLPVAPEEINSRPKINQQVI